VYGTYVPYEYPAIYVPIGLPIGRGRHRWSVKNVRWISPVTVQTLVVSRDMRVESIATVLTPAVWVVHRGVCCGPVSNTAAGTLV